MHTVFDWLALAGFAGIVSLFATRNIGSGHDPIPLGHYLIAAGAFAIGNLVGNAGYSVLYVLTWLFAGCYVAVVLKGGRDVLP